MVCCLLDRFHLCLRHVLCFGSGRRPRGRTAGHQDRLEVGTTGHVTCGIGADEPANGKPTLQVAGEAFAEPYQDRDEALWVIQGPATDHGLSRASVLVALHTALR